MSSAVNQPCRQQPWSPAQGHVSPHPCSFGASHSSGAQGILENEDPGSLCYPLTRSEPRRGFEVFCRVSLPSEPPSHLLTLWGSWAAPLALTLPASSSSRSIFTLSHSCCLSPLQGVALSYVFLI